MKVFIKFQEDPKQGSNRVSIAAVSLDTSRRQHSHHVQRATMKYATVHDLASHWPSECWNWQGVFSEGTIEQPLDAFLRTCLACTVLVRDGLKCTALTMTSL